MDNPLTRLLRAAARHWALAACALLFAGLVAANFYYARQGARAAAPASTAAANMSDPDVKRLSAEIDALDLELLD